MPYFPILQKPTQNNLITKTSFRQNAPSPSGKNRRRADCLRHRIALSTKNRRRAVSYVSTGLACLPRDANPFASTAEERLYKRDPGIAPSSRCIIAKAKNRRRAVVYVIPRFALSRRRATALFHNPVCKAQRSVPGFSSTPNSACRRYATSPSFGGCLTHRPPSPIVLRIHIVRHPSICASEMRSCADRASGHAFS